MAGFGLCAFLSLGIVHHPPSNPTALYVTPRMKEEHFRMMDRMEPTWEVDVSKKIRQEANQKAGTTCAPYMVAVVGIPGSGKTTSAAIIGELLQEQNNIPVLVMPLDGYHFPLGTLQSFSNAPDVIYRRGAPDTFDVKAVYRDLNRIRNGNEATVQLPGFDHAKGDPEPEKHEFNRSHHPIVICEGLYLLLEEDGWSDIASMFDCSIFVNANVDVCVERLKRRNKVIPGYTAEEIDIRCEKVDRVNAMTVTRSKTRADMIVESRAI